MCLPPNWLLCQLTETGIVPHSPRRIRRGFALAVRDSPVARTGLQCGACGNCGAVATVARMARCGQCRECGAAAAVLWGFTLECEVIPYS